MNIKCIGLIGLITFQGGLAAEVANAQRKQRPDRRTPPTTQQQTATPDVDRSDPPQPYLLRPGHYVYPAPYRPDYWSPHIRPFPDYNPDSYRGFGSRRSYRGFNRRGSRFGGGTPYAPRRGYGYGYGYGQPYIYDTEGAYRQGRYDSDHEYLWYIASERAGRLLNQYAVQFDEGLLNFRDGRYQRAAINMLGAAEKNHPNAASRLHAGHALFALGRYAEAVRLIARAFELRPSLPYRPYDIRDEYGTKSDFDGHLSALKSFVEQRPDDAAGRTLLGYISFYTDDFTAAYTHLQRAAELAPSDLFIPKLLNIARLTRSPAATRRGRNLETPDAPRVPRDRDWERRSQPSSLAPAPRPSGPPALWDDVPPIRRVSTHHT